VESTRTKLLEDLVGVDETPLSYINIRVPERLMKGRALGIVEPIARIESEQLQLGSVGQVCGLVDEQPAVMNARLDGHAPEGTIEAAARQGVGADTAWPRCP
jgi:hypothetical protein